MNKDKKICIYAICKDEEKFVDRFMSPIIKEVNPKDIYILDTGSSDNTIELFKKYGVHIESKTYDKFHFDVARNDSLDLVPLDYDICICLDLDDVIEPNFINQIKKVWQDDTTQLYYDYIYTTDEFNNPLVVFKNCHIHSRKNWKWESPVHEYLIYDGPNYKSVTSDELKIIHRPDKLKPRGYYLDLLEERANEKKDDTRNLYLLAREYEHQGKFDKCIDISLKYLSNKVDFNPEICKVMCYIANSYLKTNKYDEAITWSKKAIDTYPNLRDPYIIKLTAEYYLNNYEEVIKTGKNALKIEKPDDKIYSEKTSWDSTIYDIMSLSYGALEKYKEAIEMLDFAIKLNPKEERFKENKELFEKRIKEKSIE